MPADNPSPPNDAVSSSEPRPPDSHEQPEQQQEAQQEAEDKNNDANDIIIKTEENENSSNNTNEQQQQEEEEKQEEECGPTTDDNVAVPPQQEQEQQDAADTSEDDEVVEDPPPEFANVDLYSVRKEVQCPICLGIIKKTRTVMECLHRFCRDCIDKSMRMGNNECPACRTHCASRRSLRDDPRYDALIATLYPDIKKFEEEELAFCEEDETRNKQIQDSIAQVLRKQSEIMVKKRPAKDSPGPSGARTQRSSRGGATKKRKRKHNASVEYQDADDNNDNDVVDSDKCCDPDEHLMETKPKKGKSRVTIGPSSSPSSTNLSTGSLECNLEQRTEGRGLSPGLAGSAEMLAWGKGGVRSNSRNSIINGSVSKSARRMRLAKLVEFLHNLEENDEQYGALQTTIKAENGQVISTQDPIESHEHLPTVCQSPSENDTLSQVVDLQQDRLHILGREETLSGTVTSCIANGEQLVSTHPIEYRQSVFPISTLMS